MLPLLLAAAKAASPDVDDSRNFWLGCVGIRQDGVRVYSKNGASRVSDTIENFQPLPYAHAEARLLRKLGKGGIVFVARVAKKDYALTMARPCGKCIQLLKAADVERVYYTINDFQYGIFFPQTNKDIIKGDV